MMDKNITYKILFNILQENGFESNKSENKHLHYYNEKYGVLLSFPLKLNLDDIVIHRHRKMVEMSFKNNDIILSNKEKIDDNKLNIDKTEPKVSVLEKPSNSRRLLLRYVPLFILFVGFLALLNGLGYLDSWKKKKFNKPVFETTDTRFKVLVLPFKQIRSDETKVGIIINDRLKNLNRTESLNIHPYYLDISIDGNFDKDSAQYLLGFHGADLIIYGNYLDVGCEESSHDNVCYNWIVNDRWELEELSKHTNVTNNYVPITIHDLKEGILQGDTDFIVYWIVGISAFNQYQHKNAFDKFESIIDRLEGTLSKEKLKKIYIYLIALSAKLGYHQKADGYIEKSLDLSKSNLYTVKDSSLLFTAIAWHNVTIGNYKRAKEYSEIVLDILENQTDVESIELVRAYILNQTINGYLLNTSKAIQFGFKALEHLENSDNAEAAIVYSNLGADFDNKAGGNILLRDSALQFKLKALDILESINPTDSNLMVTNYKNIGHNYLMRNNFQSALNYTVIAMQIGENILSPIHPDMGGVYHALGTIYDRLGIQDTIESLKNEKFKKSLEYHLKSYEIRKEINLFSIEMSYTYEGLAIAHARKAEYDKGINYTLKAIDVLNKEHSERTDRLVYNYNNLGSLYGAKKDYANALSYLNKALEIASEEDPHIPNIQMLVKVFTERQKG